MKSFIQLLAISVLLMCVNYVYAQDATMDKVKLEKFKSWQRTGKTVTISGSTATVLGGILLVIGNSLENKSEASIEAGDFNKGQDYSDKSGACNIAGVVAGGAGLVSLIPGIIYWSIGKSKTREYQIKNDQLKVGAYYTPRHSGLTLTYRF